MRYRPESMPSLLTNDQEMRFWMVGTVIVLGVLGGAYGFYRFIGLIASCF